MVQIKQILIGGIGGQGIVLAGTLLGQAAFLDGKWVSGANSYGAAARGGFCRSEIVTSDQPIVFPHVIEADILMAMYQNAYEKNINKVKRAEGIIIYDDKFVSPERIEGLSYLCVPATRISVKELKSSAAANVIMLGAIVKITGVVTQNALRSAIEKIVPEKFRKLDLTAVDIGTKLGKLALDQPETCK